MQETAKISVSYEIIFSNTNSNKLAYWGLFMNFRMTMTRMSEIQFVYAQYLMINYDQ